MENEKYIILNNKPIKCIVKEAYFTSGKEEKLNVYFALYETGEIQPIIEKDGMGMGAAVTIVVNKKDVCGYFIHLHNIKQVKENFDHRLGFNIYQYTGKYKKKRK